MKCKNCICKDCFAVAIASCFSCDTCNNGDNFINECCKYERYKPILLSK